MSRLVLEVAGDDAGAVGEGEDAAGGGEVVGEVAEEPAAEVVEVFAVGFADFAQEQALEAGEALAVIDAHLGEEPEGFAAAAGAAVADGGGAVGEVAEAGGGAGQRAGGAGERCGPWRSFGLVPGATGADGGDE